MLGNLSENYLINYLFANSILPAEIFRRDRPGKIFKGVQIIRGIFLGGDFLKDKFSMGSSPGENPLI